MATVQIDFMLPERFNLKYIDSDGLEKTPVMIHRAPLGSLERFLAILIEQYAGVFPLWLSPVQVAILPISEKFLKQADEVKKEFEKNNIRVKLNDDNKSLGGKIRESTLQKIPFMIIIGEKEIEKGELFVTVRTREGKDLGMMEVNKFINQLKSQIENFS